MVDQGRLRDFFGFNRAKHAVIEAAILATRLSLLRDATNGQAAVFEGSGGIALVDSFRRGIVGEVAHYLRIKL